MSLEIRESLPLARFLYASEWTPVRGTYLSPLRYFTGDGERGRDPNDFLEVLKVIDVDRTNFAITRGGGLFVREDARYHELAGISALVQQYNLLLAEFSFHGAWAFPVTDIELQPGRLLDQHICIVGGYTEFAERTYGPLALLAMPKRDLGTYYGQRENDWWAPNFYWHTTDLAILDKLDGVPLAKKLRNISVTLPTLLVAACYHVTRHDLAEGIVASWIVSEEILSFLWDDYVSALSKERRERLNDHRTYSAAVRIEVLQVAGLLPDSLCATLHEARKVRNALAHRAAMGLGAAEACTRAMHAMLERVGMPIGRLPQLQMGLPGRQVPTAALEPKFKF